jgi:hypothetical protein
MGLTPAQRKALGQVVMVVTASGIVVGVLIGILVGWWVF